MNNPTHPHIRDFAGKRVHMIGIGGSSMSGLALMLLNKGYIVTGSDGVQSYMTDMLAEHGIPVTIGHFPKTCTALTSSFLRRQSAQIIPSVLKSRGFLCPTWSARCCSANS